MRTPTTLLLLAFVLGLAGCGERPFTVYLFGPATSCFAIGRAPNCDTLKVYDKVEIKVFGERQEVIYVKEGLRLDESNTVFRRLEKCNVVDRDTFSCNGLVRDHGKFVDTKALGTPMVSVSYWTYAYSNYLQSAIGRRSVQFFHDNDSWIGFVVVAACIIAVLSLGS